MTYPIDNNTSREMVEGKSVYAFTKHINLSPDCLQRKCSHFSRFSVVARARSKSRLNVLEAISIARLKAASCLQKQLVRRLRLF